MDPPSRVQLLDLIRALVAKQAKDEGLWFVTQTASEAYLQQELRKLHQLIETESYDEMLESLHGR